MLGSIDANQGDLLLGWDTDEYPFDVYETTMCMYEVLKAGGLTGGFNFDAKNRRPSNTPEDLFHAFILGMDSFALGLIKAAKLMEDGRLEENLKRRYASFSEGIGKTILDGTADLASLAAYAQEKGNAAGVESGRQEALQSVVNSILFG
jgi:xylose isomerase